MKSIAITRLIVAPGITLLAAITQEQQLSTGDNLQHC